MRWSRANISTALAAIAAKFAARFFGSARSATTTCAPGVRLARALESLGPAYIKLGQLLATRPDIVGADVASALETLAGPPAAVPDAQARKAIVERSRPGRWARCFSTFGRTRCRRLDRAGA